MHPQLLELQNTLDVAVTSSQSTNAPSVIITWLQQPRRIRYPVRTMNSSMQYFVRVTAINGAGLNVTAAGLPISVDTTA